MGSPDDLMTLESVDDIPAVFNIRSDFISQK